MNIPTKHKVIHMQSCDFLKGNSCNCDAQEEERHYQAIFDLQEHLTYSQGKKVRALETLIADVHFLIYNEEGRTASETIDAIKALYPELKDSK